jgi:hypothetical protein
MTNKRDLKAYVRYDGSGRVIAGSLVLRRSKPKVGQWHEIQGYECCTSHTLTTTVAANLSAASPLKVKLYCGNASSELLDSSTTWTLGAGWTAVSGGYAHSSGTATLTNSLAAVTDTTYKITVTVTGTIASTFSLSFGGVSTSGINSTRTLSVVATGTGSLVITPLTGFTGTVAVSIVAMPTPVLTLNSLQATATTVALLVTALNSTYPVLGTFSTTGGNNLTLVMTDAQKQAICSESKNIMMTVTA